MTNTLGWGIAGTGTIANTMASALSTLDEAKVVAVGSRSERRAAAFAKAHAIAGVHGSYEELFTDPAVDIVYVASPHSEHCAMTIAALEAGKHVLCEKAFAVNGTQARRMIDAARRTERFLMEAMWTWFLPTIADIRDRIRAGAIGEVRVVQADFGLLMPGVTGRHRDLSLAGGALLDMGIYPVALTRFLLGTPVAIRALGQIGPTGVDVNVGCVLSHEGGALGLFHTGLDAYTKFTAEIFGTDGILAIDAPFWAASGFTLRVHGGDPSSILQPGGERVAAPHQGLAHEAIHAMARIRGDYLESDVIPLATSLAMMDTMDEIRRQIGLVYPEDA